MMKGLVCFTAFLSLLAACGDSNRHGTAEDSAGAARENQGALLPPGVPRLTDSTLGELRYPAEDMPDKWVRLHGGEWHDTISRTAAREAYLTKTVRGDLNGDSLQDAVVVLFTDPGGTGKFFSLVPVIASRGQNPESLDGTVGRSSFLGDRIRAESLWVDRQRLMLRILNQAKDDPLCCPTLLEQRTYRLTRDSLLLDTTVVLRRLSRDEDGHLE
jgi:hypothetical protein